MEQLAERVARVTLLLETLNDPYPTPRSALEPDSGPAASRYVPCETCGARGEVRVPGGWQLCLICDGRGEKRRDGEPEWDAYVGLPLVEAMQLPRACWSKSSAPRMEDTYAWERLRRTYDRHGSYQAVRQGLGWLALAAPRQHRLVETVLVNHEPRLLVPTARTELELGVLGITLRVGSVRVPPWLIEQTEADRQRATIRELAACGLTAGEIARRLGLSRKAVQRKLRAA